MYYVYFISNRNRTHRPNPPTHHCAIVADDGSIVIYGEKGLLRFGCTDLNENGPVGSFGRGEVKQMFRRSSGKAAGSLVPRISRCRH